MLEEVVVTGIREAILQAQDIKRHADSNVEAITLEDLGKFANSSISDALERVPGIAIEHNAFGLDAIDGVTIRGLGPDYVATYKTALAYAPSPAAGSISTAGLLGGANLFYGYNVPIPSLNGRRRPVVRAGVERQPRREGGANRRARSTFSGIRRRRRFRVRRNITSMRRSTTRSTAGTFASRMPIATPI